MAVIDTITVTQDNITTTYQIRDVAGRQSISSATLASTPDSEISLIRAGLGSPATVTPYQDAYDAINAVIPRWRVCE